MQTPGGGESSPERQGPKKSLLMQNTALAPESVVRTNNGQVTIVEMPLNPARIKRRLADVWNIPAKALEQVSVVTENFTEPMIFVYIDLAVCRQDWKSSSCIDARTFVTPWPDKVQATISLSRLEEQERFAQYRKL